MQIQETEFVAFTIEGTRFALPSIDIKQLVRVVSVTPVPNSPKTLEGIINYKGKVIPVVNIRNWLGLIEKPVSLSDFLVVALTHNSLLAFRVDTLEDLLHTSSTSMQSAESAGIQQKGIASILKLSDGMIQIIDLEGLASPHQDALRMGGVHAG